MSTERSASPDEAGIGVSGHGSAAVSSSTPLMVSDEGPRIYDSQGQDKPVTGGITDLEAQRAHEESPPIQVHCSPPNPMMRWFRVAIFYSLLISSSVMIYFSFVFRQAASDFCWSHTEAGLEPTSTDGGSKHSACSDQTVDGEFCHDVCMTSTDMMVKSSVLLPIGAIILGCLVIFNLSNVMNELCSASRSSEQTNSSIVKIINFILSLIYLNHVIRASDDPDATEAERFNRSAICP